jgi:hypothetical protein
MPETVRGATHGSRAVSQRTTGHASVGFIAWHAVSLCIASLSRWRLTKKTIGAVTVFSLSGGDAMGQSLYLAALEGTPISVYDAMVLSAVWDDLSRVEMKLALNKARTLGKRDAARRCRRCEPQAVSRGLVDYVSNVLTQCDAVMGTYGGQSHVFLNETRTYQSCVHSRSDCLAISADDPRVIAYKLGWAEGFLLAAHPNHPDRVYATDEVEYLKPIYDQLQ